MEWGDWVTGVSNWGQSTPFNKNRKSESNDPIYDMGLVLGTNGDIAYKLTDNIAYTFVSVLRADRADHQHDFWQLDPPVLACPARLPDPASSSVGYGSAGEQPERWILPTGLPASGPQCIRVNLSRKSRLPLILKGKMKISPDLSK